MKTADRDAITRRSIALLGWGLVAIVVVDSFYIGIALRQWIWDNSRTELRFNFDIANGWERGSHVYQMAQLHADPSRRLRPTWTQFYRAFHDEYDWMVSRHPKGDYGLDYTPVRLAVMSSWVKYTREHHPGIEDWNDDVAWPLLWLNTGCEFAAALLAGLLTSYWVWRGKCNRPSMGIRPKILIAFTTIAFLLLFNINHFFQPAPLESFSLGQWQIAAAVFYLLAALLAWTNAPLVCGTLAFLLLWFNPSVILEGHTWPQWGSWILPMYLGAALLISLDWTFSAGTLLLLGCMLKGQILLAMPVLIIWPIAQGKYLSALRLLLGFAFLGALLTSVWMIPAPVILWWAIGVTASVPLLLPWALRKPIDWRVLAITTVIVTFLLAWPFVHGWQWIAALPIGAILIFPTRWTLKPKNLSFWLAGAFASAILVAGLQLGGSIAWYQIGFEYGTRHFLLMHIGPTNNLGSLLETFYHWSLHDIAGTLHFHGHLPPTQSPGEHLTMAQRLARRDSVEMRSVMGVLYFSTAILCGIAAAIHARRNDPKILVALAAPWVLFFTLMPQMHERYLMWGAAITVICVGVSTGMTLMHLLVTMLAVLPPLTTQLEIHQTFAPHVRRYLEAAHPGIAWMMLLIAAIFLVSAPIPERNRKHKT